MDGPSTSGSLPDADRVLEALTASGQLEKLRTSALQRLEQDAELRSAVEKAVAHSRALRDFQGERANKQLLAALQGERDLMADLSRGALRALWRVLSQGPEAGGISADIDAAVHAVLCRQRDAELQPVPAAGAAEGEAQQQQQQLQQQAPPP